MNANTLIFLGLVFGAAFVLAMALTMPVFGENRNARQQLHRRVQKLREDGWQAADRVDLRKNAFKDLSPLELRLETLPQLRHLRSLMAQAGSRALAHRLLLLSLALAGAALLLVWELSGVPAAALLAAALAGAAPLLRILHLRNERLTRIDEQLPDAIDVMKRALRAGLPFAECLGLVGREMDAPIASEFDQTFHELNYGSDLKWALLGLLERVPSVNIMALSTSVLIQRQTGGNLAEVLDKLSSVIRARFRFSRKIRTLSAEGRLSAWILCMLPFVLFAVIWLTTPEYLPILLEHPTGKNLLLGAAAGMLAGTLWIRRIIRIEV